jgi:tetratricopeptide (TPR) repeat protein
MRLAGEIGDVRLAAQAHAWKASHYLELGDIAAVDRETEIQEHIAKSSRQVYLRGLAMDRYSRAVLDGRFEEGEEHIRAALGEVRTGDTPHVSMLHLLREQQGRAEEILPGTASLAARYPHNTLWHVALAGYRTSLKQREEARKDLECLAVDFTAVPRNFFWLHVMERLAEVVSFVGDMRRAAMLYDLLLPYVDRCAVVAPSHSRGAVARPLGLLATLLCRYDDAERHFEKALETNARIRARIWVAHTQHDYARMLVARDQAGDREKAGGLAAQALATAREVGMKPLEADVLELQTAAGLAGAERVKPAPEDRPTSPASAVFRRDGDVWTIAYEGKGLRLKDAKGLQYIAHLLRHEGREFHAADLAAGVEVGPQPDPVRGSEATEIVAGLGDAGERLDAPARAAYRQRLQDVEAELAEATEWADSGRAEKLRAEVEFLREELSAAYGLGGRARKAVTSRIRESIERIGKEHPALARHLENAIHTGTFCRYQPDRSLCWEL